MCGENNSRASDSRRSRDPEIWSAVTCHRFAQATCRRRTNHTAGTREPRPPGASRARVLFRVFIPRCFRLFALRLFEWGGLAQTRLSPAKRPPSPRPSPQGRGRKIRPQPENLDAFRTHPVLLVFADRRSLKKKPRALPKRDERFSLSPGERAGVRAGVSLETTSSEQGRPIRKYEERSGGRSLE